MLLLQPSPFHSTMQRSKTGCAPWGFNARGHLTQQDPKKIIGSAQGELKIVKVRCFSWTPVRLHHMKWILHGYQSYQWFQWPMIYYFILYQQIHMYWPGLSQVSTYRRRPVLPTIKCQKKNGAIVSCRSLIFNDRWCAYVTACSIYIYMYMELDHQKQQPRKLSVWGMFMDILCFPGVGTAGTTWYNSRILSNNENRFD